MFKKCYTRTPRVSHLSYHQSRNFSSSFASEKPLAGKTALITGASRGIGAAIATRFAKEGARCVLIGRDEGRLNDILGGLESGTSGHEIAVGDVGDLEFWKSNKRREVDVLVNAAGITHYSPLFVTSPELLEEVVKTNLTGTMYGCRFMGRAMMGRKGDGGCIINVASLLGLKGGMGSVGYAASKAGVIGLTRALAAEVGKANVRVNAIVPGYIDTDMTAGMTSAARSEALKSIPLRRFGDAEEIADAALFLATNKYANNCVLNLDGGLSAT
ncbi:hypothetical protein B0O99DRAFT_648632 [Bisporella sp. PMI_857]|nr:hypothetical protein B0O99DRAFT_648632 [Bisporella sp. PMI_857]